jgi:small subunit ribosomal protein S9
MATKITERYFEGIGRRKTSSARVRITPAAKESVLVNDKELEKFFVVSELQKIVLDPFTTLGLGQKFMVTVHVEGGGSHSQAEALRHGIARALVKYDLNLRAQLKQAGFMKRDARAVERKKPGLKKARKSPTWSKR